MFAPLQVRKGNKAAGGEPDADDASHLYGLPPDIEEMLASASREMDETIVEQSRSVSAEVMGERLRRIAGLKLRSADILQRLSAESRRLMGERYDSGAPFLEGTTLPPGAAAAIVTDRGENRWSNWKIYRRLRALATIWVRQRHELLHGRHVDFLHSGSF